MGDAVVKEEGESGVAMSQDGRRSGCSARAVEQRSMRAAM